MEQASAVFILFLYCNALPAGAGSCSSNGPGNCSFQNPRNGHPTFCSWTHNAGISLYNYWGYPSDSFAGLTDYKNEGELVSRSACATGSNLLCLVFQYKFEQNDVIDLNVNFVIRGNIVQPPAWTTSRSNGWQYANVPINTVSNFRVLFTAKRRTGTQDRSKSVFIDNIYYVIAPCQLYPWNATPTTPVGTIPTTPPLSIAPTATNTTANLNPITDTSSYRPLTPNLQTFHSNVSNRRSPVPEASTKPKNKVGIIVGVIVAVLIVIVIVIAVLMVVFKRKHIHVWKACCKEKQPKEQFQMNAADNAAYSLEAYDSRYANAAKNHHGRQNSDNHHLQAGSATQASVTPCYENQPSKPPSAPAYAVNKRRKDAEEPKPDNQRNPNTTVYEICNVNEMNPTNAAGGEHQDLSLRVTDQGSDEHSHYSAPAPTASGGFSSAKNSHGIYHILEKESNKDKTRDAANSATSASPKGPDGEYKSLDFDKKSWGTGGNTGGAAGAMYSHLNAGAEGTYNEVHRDRKEKVIDGVYSHIK